MKTVNLLCALILVVGVSPQYSYANTFDVGKITVLFASGSGSMAFHLDGGLPNSLAAGECPSAAASAYAGVVATAAPILKSTILAAKSAGSQVTVVINGCAPGVGWYNVQDVYVH